MFYDVIPDSYWERRREEYDSGESWSIEIFEDEEEEEEEDE